MIQNDYRHISALVLLSVSVVGCSGSDSDLSLPVGDGIIIEESPIPSQTDAENSAQSGSEEMTSNMVATDAMDTEIDSAPSEVVDNGLVHNQMGIPVDDETDRPIDVVTSGVPDPMVQNTTNVSFEITVPAYSSNELQLRLSWGDFNTALNWIGDERWSIDADLPTDTEHLLSIVFFDENGGIVLGSFERQFRTGINGAEIFQVSANQFDTDRWDDDEDGVSNLDELIIGTDPRIDDDALLEVIDTQPMSLLFIANYFETQMPNERPYMDVEDQTVSERQGIIVSADIDAYGNGSMTVNTLPIVRRNSRQGDRLVSPDSIQWIGSWYYSDDYGLGQTFNSEVTVDGNTRRLVENGSGSWIGTYTHRWETTVDVSGQLVDGTDFCEVATGTITETYSNNQDSDNISELVTTTLTITRESSEDFWRVSSVFERDGNIYTREYFARELSMHMIRFGYQNLVSENDYFFCNFDDLQ